MQTDRVGAPAYVAAWREWTPGGAGRWRERTRVKSGEEALHSEGDYALYSQRLRLEAILIPLNFRNLVELQLRHICCYPYRLGGDRADDCHAV